MKVTIAGRTYNLKTNSKEKEATLNEAADRVNRKIQNYLKSASVKNELDALTITALDECVANLENSQKLAQANAGTQKIASDLKAYLAKVSR